MKGLDKIKVEVEARWLNIQYRYDYVYVHGARKVHPREGNYKFTNTKNVL